MLYTFFIPIFMYLFLFFTHLFIYLYFHLLVVQNKPYAFIHQKSMASFNMFIFLRVILTY